MLTVESGKVISAYSNKPGDVSERILREIVFPLRKLENNERSCESLSRGKIARCSVLARDGRKIYFTVKFGAREGLIVKEIKGSRFSLRIHENILKAGKNMSPKSIREAASLVVGGYVIGPCRGKHHRNRIGAWGKRTHLRECMPLETAA